VGIAILLVAILIRGFVCFREVDQFSADPDAYRVIAETLGTTGVYGRADAAGQARPTAFRPPLYPVVLSLLVVDGQLSSMGVAALHTLLGCLTVLCTYRASRRLLGETEQSRASIFAAVLVLVDPVLLHQSTLVMTETMATAISSVVLWWWVRHTHRSRAIGSAVFLGVLLALAFLCRPTFLIWGIILCFCTAAAKPHLPTNPRRPFGRAAVVAAVLLVTIGCWATRNARAIGYPVWATSHGGYTLLLANNPLFYGYLRERPAEEATWNAKPFLLAYSHRYDANPTRAAFWTAPWRNTGQVPDSVTEHEDDQLAYEAAKATISREPGMFLWSSLVRVYRLWTPFPHQTEGRAWLVVIAIGIYYTALYVAVAIGVWKLGREILGRKWWPVLSLLLTLTLVHAVYWSNMRMRAPAIPALAIIAAAAIRQPENEEEDR